MPVQPSPREWRWQGRNGPGAYAPIALDTSTKRKGVDSTDADAASGRGTQRQRPHTSSCGCAPGHVPCPGHPRLPVVNEVPPGRWSAVTHPATAPSVETVSPQLLSQRTAVHSQPSGCRGPVAVTFLEDSPQQCRLHLFEKPLVGARFVIIGLCVRIAERLAGPVGHKLLQPIPPVPGCASAVSIGGGRCSRSIHAPRAMTAARSTALRSSRTFPCQGRSRSSCIARSVNCLCPSPRSTCRRKCPASRGMSSLRSRSGGTTM